MQACKCVIMYVCMQECMNVFTCVCDCDVVVLQHACVLHALSVPPFSRTSVEGMLTQKHCDAYASPHSFP